MKNRASSSLHSLAPLLGSLALMFTPAHGSEISKLSNATALNLPGAWSGAAVPGANDVMRWDRLFTTPVNPRTVGALSAIGADLSVAGLKATNVGGTLNATNSAIGIHHASSANTLTIGANGIDLPTATQALYLEPKLALSANNGFVLTGLVTAQKILHHSLGR